MNKVTIHHCEAREILDSRGNPTVEATVVLSDGTKGTASIPSGASTGIYEACELRDNDPKRYGGKGVMKAVKNVNETISEALADTDGSRQGIVDALLVQADKTENKTKLGANAILAVSVANAKAYAKFYGLPLYRYLGGSQARRIPIPMMNVLNGGAHASNNVEIQEFMIAPVGAAGFSEALRIGSEIYHTLGKILKKDGLSTTVGDEGGYAPNLESDEKALDYLTRAIEESGYDTKTVKIALDCAAGEWLDEKTGEYRMPKRGGSCAKEDLIAEWERLTEKYPIFSIEDGLDQRDFEGWKLLTKKLGKKVMLVGDDLFVTNEKRLQEGIQKGAGNAILVKPNQIGSLTEVFKVVRLATENGYRYIPSHRSGDTEDAMLADLAVALNAPYIKTGSPCRSERVAKYNRLLAIESEIPDSLYGNL